MSAYYEILGPFALPYAVNDKRTKFINKAAGIETLQSHGVDKLRGCYVFCISGSHGAINPYYVGKSAKSFGQECFATDKINKYNAVLHRSTHGRPLLILVARPTSKGKFNAKALAALEHYLIGLAYQANDDIQNVHGIPRPIFEIIGIQAPKKGPTEAARAAFKRAFNLES